MKVKPIISMADKGHGTYKVTATLRDMRTGTRTQVSEEFVCLTAYGAVEAITAYALGVGCKVETVIDLSFIG